MRGTLTRFPSLVLALALAGAVPRLGTTQALGPEFQIHTDTENHHLDPVVAADGSGRFVVAWVSEFQDGDSFGLFAQRFDAGGNTAGSEFLVNSYTTGEQAAAAIAADAAGNFVVVWESYLQDGAADGVFARRFDAQGDPLGDEFRVNTTTAGSQVEPAVAADGAGNFVVVWQSPGAVPTEYDLFGQRFDSKGAEIGSEFRVNSYTTGSQLVPAVAADGAGRFLVVWASAGQDGSDYGVFGQRFDAAGQPAGGEFQVNTYTTAGQWAPTAAVDGAGNFIVAWQGPGDGANSGVFGRRYDAAGAPLSGEFQINSETVSDQHVPKAAANASGDFVVTWQSYYPDGSKWGVFAQRFDATGAPVEGEFQINSFTTGNQYYPGIAATGSGNFVVAWRSYGQGDAPSGIFGRRITVSVFLNGFEAGNVCSWSAAVGSSGSCGDADE
jgi:hypothetical protein